MSIIFKLTTYRKTNHRISNRMRSTNNKTLIKIMLSMLKNKYCLLIDRPKLPFKILWHQHKLNKIIRTSNQIILLYLISSRWSRMNLINLLDNNEQMEMKLNQLSTIHNFIKLKNLIIKVQIRFRTTQSMMSQTKFIFNRSALMNRIKIQIIYIPLFIKLISVQILLLMEWLKNKLWLTMANR